MVESVYSAVRTDSIYKADYVWSLNNRGGKCLQRGGTDPYIKQITFGLEITVVESVYSAVRTDSLYKADYFSLNKVKLCKV